MSMKRYILTLFAIISLIAVSATNQTNQKNRENTTHEVDELLSEDEILSGDQKNEDKIRPDSIGIDIPEFLKNLDEIYDAPTLLTWFHEAYKMKGGITIRPVELTNMYTGNKYYRLLFKVERAYGISSRLISVEETATIIDALKNVNEYINKSLSESSEEVSYTKNFSSNVNDQISFWFDYDADNYKWKGYIRFMDVASQFDNVIRDLPQFIELLKQGVNALEARRVNGDLNKKLLIEAQKNGDKLYYWENKSQYDDLHVTPIEYIDERFFYGNKYIEDKNNILKDIIKDNNPKIDSLGKYGYIDIVWNPKGKVVNVKLMISKDAARQLSERTIKIMLNKIREFKIKKYQTTKDEDCEYMRVAIPLEMKN